MATSNIVHTGEEQPVVDKGHGTEALGPSDTSDSGSDIMGGPGLSGDDMAINLDTGTTSDPDRGGSRKTGGPDVGDANLDSDSDSSGTGERATAGRDSPLAEGSDISTDRIGRMDDPAEGVVMREDSDGDGISSGPAIDAGGGKTSPGAKRGRRRSRK